MIISVELNILVHKDMTCEMVAIKVLPYSLKELRGYSLLKLNQKGSNLMTLKANIIFKLNYF